MFYLSCFCCLLFFSVTLPLHIDENLHLSGIFPVDIKETTSSTVFLLFLSEYFDILQTISGGDSGVPLNLISKEN